MSLTISLEKSVRECYISPMRRGQFNACKTHCLRGHEYTPENTNIQIRASGVVSRKCRQCARDRNAARPKKGPRIARTPAPKPTMPWPDCQEWPLSRSRAGYGLVKGPMGKMELAHRAVWEYFNGPIPPGMYICHRCDHRPCVNPAHLFLGTPTDNTQDMIAKGRARMPAEVNRHKTHRIHGHPFDAANTYVNPTTGGRVCKTCRDAYLKEYHKTYRAKRRAVAC